MEDRKLDVLMARIDERTGQMERMMKEIKGRLDDEYVRKSELAPIKAIVYGMVALILVGFASVLIALVVRPV